LAGRAAAWGEKGPKPMTSTPQERSLGNVGTLLADNERERIEQLAIQVVVLAGSLLDDNYELSLKDPPDLGTVHKLQQLTEILHEKAGAIVTALRSVQQPKTTTIVANRRVVRRQRKAART
jgi:hypothetical protein